MPAKTLGSPPEVGSDGSWPPIASRPVVVSRSAYMVARQVTSVQGLAIKEADTRSTLVKVMPYAKTAAAIVGVPLARASEIC
jgi:hypothetical protein